MNSSQAQATDSTPTNTYTRNGKEENYVWIDPEVNIKIPKTYEFHVDDEVFSISAHEYEYEPGKTAKLHLCPLDDEGHKVSDKNAKVLNKLDQALYDTTYNFFHEPPLETAVRVFKKGKEFDYQFKQGDTMFIIMFLVKDGHLPKTSVNCGDRFRILSLDAKLRSGETIVDSKIKGTEIVLTNALFIGDLVMRNRIRIRKCVIQVDDYEHKILCESNKELMSALTYDHKTNLQPDTRINYQLKALKERAEFIQTNLDLEFLSGSIKLDPTNFIIFKDNEINLINKTKGKKRVIAPFELVVTLNDDAYAPEILYNPDGLLKKGDNNNFITLKYNNKRHDLSTIDGVKNRVMQTLTEAYNKNLKRDIDKLLDTVRAINNATEDIDSIMSPWTQVKQSHEVGNPNPPAQEQEKRKPNKPEEETDKETPKETDEEASDDDMDDLA